MKTTTLPPRIEDRGSRIEDRGRSATLDPRSSTPSRAAAGRSRIEAVDVLRGLVMVLMVQGHANRFLLNLPFNPLDVTQTEPLLFLTRWVGNFCPPVFILLAGIGVALVSRNKTRPELARFLAVRGLWLILLELTVIRFGWFFSLDWGFFWGQVFWVQGWSMILLAGLTCLPRGAVVAFGLASILGHHLLDFFRPEPLGALGGLWAVVHGGGTIQPLPGVAFQVVYPLIPWSGVMALGYGLGPWLLQDRPVRRRRLVLLGGALTLGFVLLRAANLYGDPHPWSAQGRGWLFTLFSFLHCEKHPPSLLYLLLTLGPSLLLLAWLDRDTGPLGRPLQVIGRVPLFFYLLHLPVLHAVALILAFTWHGAWTAPSRLPPGHGFSLGVVYLVWVGVVVLLYPLCRWYWDYKRQHRGGWLTTLL